MTRKITKITPADRQDLLKKRGVTQKQIAIEIGVAEMSISREIHFGVFSNRIRCAIAKKIGLPVEQAFPEYYSKHRSRRRKTTDLNKAY